MIYRKTVSGTIGLVCSSPHHVPWQRMVSDERTSIDRSTKKYPVGRLLIGILDDVARGGAFAYQWLIVTTRR